MSIAEQITRIKNNVAASYTECEAKGATIPANANSENLPATIASITGGQAIGSEINYTNITGADVKANDKLYINNSAITTTVATVQPDLLYEFSYVCQTSDPKIIICRAYNYHLYRVSLNAGEYTKSIINSLANTGVCRTLYKEGILANQSTYLYSYVTNVYSSSSKYYYYGNGYASKQNVPYKINTNTLEIETSYNSGFAYWAYPGWSPEDNYILVRTGSVIYTFKIEGTSAIQKNTISLSDLSGAAPMGSLNDEQILFGYDSSNGVKAYQYSRTDDDVNVTAYDITKFPTNMQRMFTTLCYPFWNEETKVLTAYFNNGTILAYQYVDGVWKDVTPVMPVIPGLGQAGVISMSADFSKITTCDSLTTIRVYDGNQLAAGNYAVPYSYTNEASLIASAKEDVISGGTGTAIVGTGVSNQTISVTPSTEAQTIYPQSNYTGIGQVNVSAVTSSIDSNIKAANIKSGVSILGVSGTVTPVNNTTASITANGTYTPDSAYTGYSEVTVNVPSATTTLSITPSTSAQTLTPDASYVGYSQVDVSAVDANIDSNIQADNIKSGVSILGVTGTYTGGGGRTDLPVTIDNGMMQFVDPVEYTFPDDVTELNIPSMFKSKSNLTTLNFNNIEIIDTFEYGAQYVTTLTTVNAPNLKTLGQDGFIMGFFGNPLTTFNVPNLETVGQGAFEQAFSQWSEKHQSQIEDYVFPKVKNMTYSSFWYCWARNTKVKSISFPALTSTSFGDATSCFGHMLDGCDGVTVHFPSNLESVLSTWEDVQNGFSGTNTTVLYDLDATE